MAKASGWWDSFFVPFRPVFDIVSQKNTNAQIRYLIEKLNLKAGKRFLDCPCGLGRIALSLARKGIKVTGVDITSSYLEELEKKAKRRRLRIELIQSDMRRVNFTNRFDAAANIWTSFGYFEKESDNLLVLKKMFQALKPGGKFMLNLINRDWLIANFEPKGWFQAGNVKVLEEREFDYERSRSTGTWCFIKDGVESTHEISLRVYSYHELVQMFRQVGFVDIQGFSSPKDEPVSRDNSRIFVIGSKPKA